MKLLSIVFSFKNEEKNLQELIKCNYTLFLYYLYFSKVGNLLSFSEIIGLFIGQSILTLVSFQIMPFWSSG